MQVKMFGVLVAHAIPGDRTASRQDQALVYIASQLHNSGNFGAMVPSGNLLAWIEPCGGDQFVGAFVGEGEVRDARRPRLGRAPATQLCASPNEARQWVEDQAAAFGLPVKWLKQVP